MRLKRRTWALICAFLMSLGAELLGVIFSQHECAWAKNVSIALFAGIAIWLIIDAVLMNRMDKSQLILSDLREKLDRKKKAIETDPEQVRRRIARKALLVRAIHALMILIVLAMAFFCGQAGSSIWRNVGQMFALLLLPELICVYLHSGRLAPPANWLLVKPECFPLISETIQEAARLSGCRRPVRLYASETGSIGAFSGKRFYEICADSVLASMLTREELKNVFLHEFAHLTRKQEKQETGWRTLAERLDFMSDTTADWDFFSLGRYMVGIVYMRFAMELADYFTLINRSLEFEADRQAAEKGDAQTLVNALAKISLFSAFGEEDSASGYRIFESETPPENPEALIEAEFERLKALRGAYWREERETALLANLASHPTFRQRREALKITEYTDDTAEPNADYRAEVSRLRLFVGKTMLQGAGDYGELRKANYLERKAEIDRLDQPNLETREKIDGMYALIGLDDARVETLAREILEKEPNNTRAALALAHSLSLRRDDECIDWFYKAAENVSCAPKAMGELGEYLLRRGYADKLADYRARSDSLQQKTVDFHENLDKTLAKQMEDPRMPPETLSTLISEITRGAEDEIDAVYCCAKPLPDGKYAHVFFLDLSSQTRENPERCEAIFDRAFYILDERKESYALEDAEDCDMFEIQKRAPHCIAWQRKS